MTSLNDTYAGREILRMLYQKYGTLDQETLLSVLVMQHADVIFTRAETDVLTKRIALAYTTIFGTPSPLPETGQPDATGG